MEEIKVVDDNVNVTRFLVPAREPIIAGTDRPHKSRPLKQHPLRVVDDSNQGSVMHFDYLLYIDIEASMAEPRAQHALGVLHVCPLSMQLERCFGVSSYHCFDSGVNAATGVVIAVIEHFTWLDSRGYASSSRTVEMSQNDPTVITRSTALAPHGLE
ncbi:hypothetical protein JHK82_011896 [Glycine max]|nr:hypothetical protein JHK86_011895 [Glycine max]KAG5153927.1 hypothetical protein JHK82_011896 [Glycine max]